MRFVGPHPLFALLLALPTALFAVSASAASEPTPTELSVARRLFDEGRAAEDAARWHEAADKFRKATAIKDTPGMRFHLARCEEEQGAFVEALVEYDRARELIDSGIRAADVEKLLADSRERVRAKVSLLTLRLPEGVQNVSVELDGKALSAQVLGVPMPINPGKHHLNAVAVGRTTFTGELELGTGEVKQLAIELPIATTVPPRTPVAPQPEPAHATGVSLTPARPADVAVSTRTVVLVGEASLSVAGLATGIVFMVARSSAADRMTKANENVVLSVPGGDPDGTACALKSPPAACGDLDQARQDHLRDGNWATAGFVAAGVSAAAFGLTYWLWPHATPPAQVGVGVTPGRLDLAKTQRPASLRASGRHFERLSRSASEILRGALLPFGAQLLAGNQFLGGQVQLFCGGAHTVSDLLDALTRVALHVVEQLAGETLNLVWWTLGAFFATGGATTASAANRDYCCSTTAAATRGRTSAGERRAHGFHRGFAN
jgi:hypothetical protein